MRFLRFCKPFVKGSSKETKYVDVVDDHLYVILPYFNYCKFQRRKQLFEEFVERLRREPKVRIIISEAAKVGEAFQLPAFEGVFLHLRNEVQHCMWIKENLINVAATMLPSTWRYMAWIDADITFLNTNWVADTVAELQNKDVVQLFHSCVNLGPDGEALKVENSFAYMHLCSGRPYHPASKYGCWHPGYAYALTRKAFFTMGGLIDFAILGSGDRHMVMAWVGLAHISHPGNIHENYKKKLMEYQTRVNGFKLGYVKGTILHHWHGRIADRRYRERWDIITKGYFDPCADIVKGMDGLWRFTDIGKRLEGDIREYFVERREDNMKA